MDFPGGSAVKNLPAKQEMRIWFLGQEDPLKKGMATDSSITSPGKGNPCSPGGLQSTDLWRVEHDLVTK